VDYRKGGKCRYLDVDDKIILDININPEGKQ
jgi:hypothetical protein